MVVVLVVGGGAGPVVLKLFDIAFHVGLLKTILYVGGIGAVIFFGLRNTIVVTEQRVTIVKHWFFIPYWRWTAREIESVWFGGD